MVSLNQKKGTCIFLFIYYLGQIRLSYIQKKGTCIFLSTLLVSPTELGPLQVLLGIKNYLTQPNIFNLYQ